MKTNHFNAFMFYLKRINLSDGQGRLQHKLIQYPVLPYTNEANLGSGLSKAASSSVLLDTTGSSSQRKAESSPDRKQERRGREGSRTTTDSPDSKAAEDSAGRRTSATADSSSTAGFKSLDNLSGRSSKHSDISRKHSDSSISRVSSTTETSSTSRPAEARPAGVAAHSTNLGRPEGKSFALPDRPADLKAAEGRQQQRRPSGGSSSQTPPRSGEAIAVQAATTAVGRQGRPPENGLSARPDNETVIGWKPIQTLQGSPDKKALTEKTAGVLTVEEEVSVSSVVLRRGAALYLLTCLLVL
jgi:hypothetical protein